MGYIYQHLGGNDMPCYVRKLWQNICLYPIDAYIGQPARPCRVTLSSLQRARARGDNAIQAVEQQEGSWSWQRVHLHIETLRWLINTSIHKPIYRLSPSAHCSSVF